MNNFKGGSFQSHKPQFGGKKKFGSDKKFDGGQHSENRPSGHKPELFSATCAECTKKCEVPFKPSHDKPVYCSACFGMKKSANEPRSFDNNNRADRGSNNHGQTNFMKRPREERSPRHDPTRGRGNDGIADLKRQITGLELKLNRILELINPPLPSTKVPLPKKETVVANVTKKKVAKKVVKKAAKAAPKKAVKKTKK